jgi:hypothetical protein
VDSDTSAVAICIPWRPQPHRIAAYERVRRFYRDVGLDDLVIIADSDPLRDFNLSDARNRAVQMAGNRGAEVVVVADADTIPDFKVLMRAVKRASRYGRVIYPFTEYVYLGDVNPELLEDFNSAPIERVYTASVGGMVVLTTRLYWELGGFDDCFTRWGYEDNAFLAAAQTLAQVERLEGKVWAFSHDAERDLSGRNPGSYRMSLYRYAQRDPHLMRELVKRW